MKNRIEKYLALGIFTGFLMIISILLVSLESIINFII